MKNFTIILLFIIFNSAFAKTKVHYSEAADVFEIMDHVSLWHEQQSAELRSFWEKKFGAIKSEDEQLLEEYRVFRKKSYQRIAKENNGKAISPLFENEIIKNTPLSSAFYSSKGVGEALKKLTRFHTEKEILFLRKFYKHFLPKIKEMVKESTNFKSHIMTLNELLKKSKSKKISKHLEKFLGLKIKSKNSIQFLMSWWPNSATPMIESRGNFLILRYHPLAGSDSWNKEKLNMAIIDLMFRAQSMNQKENMSKIFNKYCIGRSIEFNNSMKKIWGEILPSRWKEKKKFSLYRRWSNDNFTNTYIKLLFPMLEEAVVNKKKIDGKFIQNAAKACGELHDLATGS